VTRIGQYHDDLEVARLCCEGDRVVCRRLFEQAFRLARRILFRILGPDAEHEDVVQQAMIEVFASLPRYRGEASLKTWMGRICVNVARQVIRKRKRTRMTMSIDANSPMLSGQPGPFDQVEAIDLAVRLHRILDELDADKRIAVTLYELQGLSINEVASVTGVGLSTAKSRIWYGRKYLARAARKDPVLAQAMGHRQTEETNGLADPPGETNEPQSEPGRQTKGKHHDDSLL